jgi:hypothetical protein
MGWHLSNIVVALEKHYNRTPGLQEAAAKRFDDLLAKTELSKSIERV